jgi:hypothetical protein
MKCAMSGLTTQSNIGWIPCAAHKIQLCIKDALKRAKDAAAILDKCHALSSFLRNNTVADQGLQLAQKALDPTKQPLKALGYCPTRWNSWYIMGVRLSQLQPAIRELEISKAADKKFVELLQAKMLDDDEFATLRDVLQVLEPSYKFTLLVSTDRATTISKVYPELHDMSNGSKTPSNPTAEALQLVLINELEKRWPLINIPDLALMATYLDPTVVQHPIFSGIFESDGDQISIKDRAKALILETLISMPNDKLATPPDTEHLSSKIGYELQGYFEEATEVPCELYRDKPHEWWKDRSSAFPHLSSLARVLFSVQAASVPAERLFSRAGNILTDQRSNMKDYTFLRLLTVYNLHNFLENDSL